MTQKELAYVEDAINHEQNVGLIITEIISLLENKNLQAFMKQEFKKHQAIAEKLMNLLEEEIA